MKRRVVIFNELGKSYEIINAVEKAGASNINFAYSTPYSMNVGDDLMSFALLLDVSADVRKDVDKVLELLWLEKVILGWYSED